MIARQRPPHICDPTLPVPVLVSLRAQRLDSARERNCTRELRKTLAARRYQASATSTWDRISSAGRARGRAGHDPPANCSPTCPPAPRNKSPSPCGVDGAHRLGPHQPTLLLDEPLRSWTTSARAGLRLICSSAQSTQVVIMSATHASTPGCWDQHPTCMNGYSEP